MTTGSLSCGAVTSTGDFSNGSNNLTTGIATIGTLRGAGTTDTLMVDRNVVITTGNRYYALNGYYDSGVSNWKYVTNGGWASAISLGTDGTVNFISAGSAATASGSTISSMSTKMSISPSSGFVLSVPTVSTASASFAAMTCSAMTSTGTMSCGTNAMTCGSLSSRAINSGTYSLTCGTIASTAINTFTTGSVVCGINSTTTSRTDNFLYIPTAAGKPTGTPTSNAGLAPICYDTTDNRLYVYNSGWWWVGTSNLPLSSESKIDVEKKVRSRASSVASIDSDKSEKTEILFEIEKLAKMDPGKYKEYMDTIDKLVKMRRGWSDLEDEQDEEWEE